MADRPTRLQRALRSPSIRSAIRLTLAMVVGNALLLAIFGETPPATQGSFAIVIFLLLLDYDGTARERFISYSIATALGAVIVTLGVLISPWPWLSVLVTIPMMFAFAFARVLRGFIARSTVGLPLAFFLPVMTGVPITDLGQTLAGWIIGCAIAITFAMLVLPRRRTGIIRRALAEWCLASADLVRSLAGGQAIDRARTALDAAYAAVHASMATGFDRPGAVSPRLRALLQLSNTATTATYVADTFQRAQGTPHPQVLAGPSEAALRSAASFVRLEQAQETTGLIEARNADLASARSWSIERLRTAGGRAAVAELSAHYPIRLASISATTVQWLAAASAGRRIPPPDIGFMQTSNPRDLIRSNLTAGSPWLRNAIRTALAAAIAVAIAKALGLQHGFWVVMATLSLIQTTFSGSSSGRRAWRDALGAVAGVIVGAIAVSVAPSEWIFVLGLAAAAFAVKTVPSRSPALVQFVFSIFVIANVTILTWPPSESTAEFRLIDVAIGSAVAIGLTFMIFPRGIDQLIERTLRQAVAASDRFINACRATLIDPEPDFDTVSDLRAQCARAVVAYSDALDAGYMSMEATDPRLPALRQSEALLRDCLIAGDAMVSLTRIGERPADVPGLAATLTDAPDEARIAEVADRERASIEAHPFALACTVWASWWLSYLARARQAAGLA